MQFTSCQVGKTGTIKKFTYQKPIKNLVQRHWLLGVLLVTNLFWGLKCLWVLVGAVYIWKNQEVVEESMYVIKNIGVQINKKTVGGGVKRLFLECSNIKELIINEVLSPYNVRIYLGIILKKGDQVTVPFEDFEITLEQAKEIYNSSQELLFE